MGIKEILIFAAGFGLGAVVVNKLVEKKYEEISEQEIASVKEVYHKKFAEKAEQEQTKEESEKKDIKEETEEMTAYSKEIKKNGYSSEAIRDNDMPYVITPEAYMEPNGYDKLACTWYENEVLTDENNEPLDIEEIVGSKDVFDRMGEFETDTLYIRNDSIEADYEIQMEHGAYIE